MQSLEKQQLNQDKLEEEKFSDKMLQNQKKLSKLEKKRQNKMEYGIPGQPKQPKLSKTQKKDLHWEKLQNMNFVSVGEGESSMSCWHRPTFKDLQFLKANKEVDLILSLLHDGEDYKSI